MSYDVSTQSCLASFRSTPTFTKPSHVVCSFLFRYHLVFISFSSPFYLFHLLFISFSSPFHPLLFLIDLIQVFKHQGMGAVTEIRTLHTTSPQTLLSRSTMFQHPSSSRKGGKPTLLTAAADEDKRQVSPPLTLLSSPSPSSQILTSGSTV